MSVSGSQIFSMALWVSAALTAVPRVSLAAPRFELWVRTDASLGDCPDAPGLEQRVRARLGPDSSPEAEGEAEPIRVTVRFAEDGSAIRAHIRLTSATQGQGERRLEAPLGSCKGLADATVLAVTLLVEEAAERSERDGAHSEVAPAESSEPSGEQTKSPTPVRPRAAPGGAAAGAAGRTTPPRRCPDNPDRVTHGFDVVALVAHRVGPETMWGAGLRGILGFEGSWAMSWGAELLTGGVARRAGYAFRFSQSTFWLGPSLRLSIAPGLLVEPELALLAGASHVAVFDARSQDPGNFPLIGCRAGAVLGWKPWQPVRLSLGAHARVLPLNDVYHAVDADGPLWSQSHLGYSAEFGLGLDAW